METNQQCLAITNRRRFFTMGNNGHVTNIRRPVHESTDLCIIRFSPLDSEFGVAHLIDGEAIAKVSISAINMK